MVPDGHSWGMAPARGIGESPWAGLQSEFKDCMLPTRQVSPLPAPCVGPAGAWGLSLLVTQLLLPLHCWPQQYLVPTTTHLSVLTHKKTNNTIVS